MEKNSIEYLFCSKNPHQATQLTDTEQVKSTTHYRTYTVYLTNACIIVKFI
jgi:hypothetical protein